MWTLRVHKCGQFTNFWYINVDSINSIDLVVSLLSINLDYTTVIIDKLFGIFYNIGIDTIVLKSAFFG